MCVCVCVCVCVRTCLCVCQCVCSMLTYVHTPKAYMHASLHVHVYCLFINPKTTSQKNNPRVTTTFPKCNDIIYHNISLRKGLLSMQSFVGSLNTLRWLRAHTFPTGCVVIECKASKGNRILYQRLVASGSERYRKRSVYHLAHMCTYMYECLSTHAHTHKHTHMHGHV